MPFTENSPKCLVPVAGRPILYYQLVALQKCGIRDIVMAVGYRAEKIKEYAAVNFSGLSFRFVENPEYESTNDIYSFALAEKYCPGDFLQIDSDVLFPSEVLEELLASPQSVSATCVRRARCGKEEMKVCVDDRHFIRKIGKQLSPQDAAGEFMSVSLFRKEFAEKLFQKMREMIEAVGPYMYSGDAMNEVLKENKSRLLAVYAKPDTTIEVDFSADLRRAEKIVARLAGGNSNK